VYRDCKAFAFHSDSVETLERSGETVGGGIQRGERVTTTRMLE
jgi:hypothetical protein